MGFNLVKDIVNNVKIKHGWIEDELLKKEEMSHLVKSFSPHAKISDYRDRVLFIEVPSSVLLQELSMKKQEMFVMLREYQFKVKEIKFLMKGKRV